MLPKKDRINLSARKRWDGRKVGTDLFNVIYKDSTSTKCAVVVSKSIAKRAVDRNGIKRKIMEATREINQKGEYIFIVKKNINEYKKQEILSAINNAIKKIND